MKTKILLLISLLSFACFTQAQTMRSKTEPLKVGETAPDWTLTDQNKNKITLSKTETPVILVFYRGYWCPFCARQLSELRSLLNKDEKVSLYAISVDDAEKSSKLAAKIAKDGKGE